MESHSDHVVLFPSVFEDLHGSHGQNRCCDIFSMTQASGKGGEPAPLFSLGVNSEHLRLGQAGKNRAAAPGKLGSGPEAQQGLLATPRTNGAPAHIQWLSPHPPPHPVKGAAYTLAQKGLV